MTSWQNLTPRLALRWVAAVLIALAAGLVFWSRLEPTARNPVIAAGPETIVMDFSTPFSLNPLPPGWWHRTFWTRPAMKLRFAQRGGWAGLVCETRDSGSIFGRFSDIPLTQYPRLGWIWRVDKPIAPHSSELTREGDDHAARLFIRFTTETGARRAMEIVWSNGELKTGTFKYLGTFAHYVARSGASDLRRWVEDEVDLLKLYRTIWKDRDKPRITFVALFCDSDDTGLSSEAGFYKVWVKRSRSAGPN